ncbi:uncharacterized protein K452DRAFT_295199 [Aplosporella prunicola CBS 121167]|uniref:Uncharacterized protein n=1 Tax=Aplosporella prunicola CBS 121167 TaxID=1176127 RepID=A0A6A6BQ90_9PEZI|nr:uncharacterized protein K452DRAFT_295199 [Aplosporella prunicola CBS 121167]KAF2145593.1 hypothetical protein K452DRAFT_295199 [Aplosporella prunicola CBS 121167]
MSSQDDLDLLAALLTNLRNTKATFGEDSNQYQEMKAMVDEHISASAVTLESKDSKPSNAPPQQEQAQPQHFFNLAFRPRMG